MPKIARAARQLRVGNITTSFARKPKAVDDGTAAQQDRAGYRPRPSHDVDTPVQSVRPIHVKAPWLSIHDLRARGTPIGMRGWIGGTSIGFHLGDAHRDAMAGEGPTQ